MDLSLKGKIAVVAASSRGLGRAAAAALAAEGASLVMCARGQEALEDAADRICATSGTEVHTVALDLASSDGPAQLIREAVDRFGGVDILVTNVGGPPVGMFTELTDEAWASAFEQVVMSVVRLVRAAVPPMTLRGGGRIVNIASISVKEPIASLLLSNALRASVVGLAKTLSRELAPHGILVNTVCPGRIATTRLVQLDEERASRSGRSLEEVRAEAQRAIPLGRYGHPEELAALITFLASGRASYITGTTILCDGGLFSGLM